MAKTNNQKTEARTHKKCPAPRYIKYKDIVAAVAELCVEANYHLTADVRKALEQAIENETHGTHIAKEILQTYLENADIAAKGTFPICQDCGTATFYVKLGAHVLVVGGTLTNAINAGVRRGYRQGYLRKSIVDLNTGKNTQNNTPANIHIEIVSGSNIDILFAPKGGGSENMSTLYCLTPYTTNEKIVELVVNRIKSAGGNPCPPTIVGICIGGASDEAMAAAKQELLREVGTPSADPECAELEHQIYEQANKLGVGPQGIGGNTAVLAVHITKRGRHIASKHVAIAIGCWCTRKARRVLRGRKEV